MKYSDESAILMDMGFSRLEAEIYLYLLQNSPATGYRIARDLGQQISNVYSIIKSMHEKGMLLLDDAEKRYCRAVPPDELMQLLEISFHKKKQQITELIKKLPQQQFDNRVYQLSLPEQVYEKAKKMLSQCRDVAFVDAFPEIMAKIKTDIRKATKRGVKVAVQAYETVSIPGAMIIKHRNAIKVLEHWPDQWLTMAVDGEQFLLAYIKKGGKSVIQSAWSSSPLIAWAYQSCAYSDVLLSALVPLIESGKTNEMIGKTYFNSIRKTPYPDIPGKLIMGSDK